MSLPKPPGKAPNDPIKMVNVKHDGTMTTEKGQTLPAATTASGGSAAPVDANMGLDTTQ